MTKKEYITQELAKLDEKEKDLGLSGMDEDIKQRLLDGWICDVDDCLALLSPAEVHFCEHHYLGQMLCMLHQKEFGRV